MAERGDLATMQRLVEQGLPQEELERALQSSAEKGHVEVCLYVRDTKAVHSCEIIEMKSECVIKLCTMQICKLLAHVCGTVNAQSKVRLRSTMGFANLV